MEKIRLLAIKLIENNWFIDINYNLYRFRLVI
jgi:hypothetical protein